MVDANQLHSTPPVTETKCHIHDSVTKAEEISIRSAVCAKAGDTRLHTDGNAYCILHLPSIEKDVVQFDATLRRICDRVRDRVIAAKADGSSLHDLSYSFQYVYFPSDVIFSDREFEVPARFEGATFKADAYFEGVTFRGTVSFACSKFCGHAHFSKAKFLTDAHFGQAEFAERAGMTQVSFDAKAWFAKARFLKDADFARSALSGEANFEKVLFKRVADFSRVRFNKIDFARAKFGSKGRASFYLALFENDAYFKRTRFYGPVTFDAAHFAPQSYIAFLSTFFADAADFKYSTAEGYLLFKNLRQSRKNLLEFQDVAYDRAIRVAFHTVDLHPNWFVNVDSRKFVFTDVFWIDLDWDLRNRNIDRELRWLQSRGIKDEGKRLLEIAARQLAVNAEENNRYDEAAKFRYMAMETRRLEEKRRLSASRLLTWLYKWSSGYGESWNWAAAVLIGLLFAFGILYSTPFASFDSQYSTEALVGPPPAPSFPDALHEGVVYSLYVAALQRPDPKPANTRTRFFVILETIAAPLQVALLALAIRRKFMR